MLIPIAVFRERAVLKILIDPRRRAEIVLYFGAAFHFFFAAFRLFTGVLYQRFYLDATALFYLLLSFNRLVLIRAYREVGEHRYTTRALLISRRVLLLTLGVMLVLMWQTVAGMRSSSYPPYIALVSGLYALASSALAVYELVYAKRLKSSLLSASRTVSLTAAVLSAFTFLTDLFFSVEGLFSPPVRTALLLSLGISLLVFIARLSKKKGA